jgi:hypothetical protein
MHRLYMAILTISIGIAQAAMIPQTADKFKTFKEVGDPILDKSMFNGFKVGMLQQLAFFSVCHAVKGQYAFGVYGGSCFVAGCAALQYSFNNLSKATALERIDEQSALMVYSRINPFVNRVNETERQEMLRKFLPVYTAVRQAGTVSGAHVNISNAYNQLLTQYAQRFFNGFGYVLSAACGPCAALLFLTGCTFGILPCTMEGYE